VVIDQETNSILDECLRTFRRRYRELGSAIVSYFQLQREIATRIVERHNQDDFLERMHSIIYERPDDGFKTEIENITATTTDALKRYVKNAE
jgi:hypothetical protein